MKLKKYKLRKLCLPNQIGKYGIPAPAIAYSNGKIRYLRISDISEEGTLVNTDKKSVESDDIEQYILEENDIVFARTGNSTGRAYLYDKRDGVMAYAGFLIKYQLDEHKVNPIYLRYFTLSTFYKQWVANLSVGSTRGNISAQTFADCPIVLPPRHQQDVLVETLSNIDAKIKLNRQINDNLEAMAKQLYDYWFVQFDFPNEEGKPYKSSGGAMAWNEKLKREIPQGWSGVSLKDLALTSRNAMTPVENEVYQHFSIPSFDACGSYSLDNGSDIKSDKFVLQKGQLLVSKLNPWFNRVVWVPKGTNMIGSTEFVVLNPNNESESGYIYSVIKSPKFIAYCSQAATGTSHSQRRVSPDVLMTFKVVYEQGVVQKYGCLIEKIQKQQAELLSEIAMLTKQRDELLPLLMNGQASVNYHLFVMQSRLSSYRRLHPFYVLLYTFCVSV